MLGLKMGVMMKLAKYGAQRPVLDIAPPVQVSTIKWAGTKNITVIF